MNNKKKKVAQKKKKKNIKGGKHAVLQKCSHRINVSFGKKENGSDTLKVSPQH